MICQWRKGQRLQGINLINYFATKFRQAQSNGGANSARRGVLAKISNQSSLTLDQAMEKKKKLDLVIGADGAWSKIRSLVTDVKPKFVNQHYITTSIRNISSTYPHHTSRRSFALFPSQIYQRGRTCLPRMLQAEEQERPVQNHLYELPSPVQR